MVKKLKSPPDSLIIDKENNAPKALRDLLMELLHPVLTYLEEFKKNPENPENVHQLRVSLRKLRSVLFFSKSFMNSEVYKYRQQTLRNLYHQLSELRELDVLSQECIEISDILKISPIHLDSLHNIIIAQRDSSKSNILKKVVEGIFTNVIWDFKNWLGNNPFAENDIKEISISAYTNTRLPELNDKISRILKSADLSDNEELHRIRIQGKKLRYTMEIIKPLVKKFHLKKNLKELQDILGDLHDTYRNITLIKNLIKDSSAHDLILQAGIFMGFQAAEAAILRERFKELAK